MTEFKILGHTPFWFQKDTIIFGIQNMKAGFCLDVGLGKTRCAIDTIRYFKNKELMETTLVVCPTSMMESWKESISFYAHEYAICIEGTKQKREKLLTKSFEWYIINYEALDPYLLNLKKLKPDAIIFDEVSRYLKTWDSSRTKASIFLADRAKYKLLLTATPLSKDLTQIWPFFRVLDEGQTFGRDFRKWRKEYFNKRKFENFTTYRVKRSYETYISKMLNNKCIFFKKEDVKKDLPDKIYQTLPIVLPDSYMSQYESIQENIISEIETEGKKRHVNVQHIFTKLIRLQEFTSGFITDVSGEKIALDFTPKLDLLEESILEIISSGESCIVWTKFKKSLAMISERLQAKKIKFFAMSGDDNSKEKFTKWSTFQTSNTINVFVAQISAGGVGIELFKKDSTEDRTQHSLFYENDWAEDVRTQAEGRPHREGQKSTCRYVDYLVKNTIDYKIYWSIKQTRRASENLLKLGIREFLTGDYE